MSDTQLQKQKQDNFNKKETQQINSYSKQQNYHTQYLKKLLARHVKQSQKAQLFLEQKQQFFSFQILQGKYQIKNRQWSQQQQKKTQNTQKDTKIIKKKLQNQLQQIQKQLSNEQNQKNQKNLTEQERIQFMKRIQKQKKQMMKKKEQLLKKQAEIQAQKQRKYQQQQAKLQLQKKQKKKQQVIQRLKQAQQTKKKKQQQLKVQQAILKQKLKQKTMVDKIEQKFQQIQNQSLEERKQRLAQIRALHKPIDKKQLDAHSQKYQQLQAQRQAALQQKPIIQSSTAFYKSIFYKKAKEEQSNNNILKSQQQELSRLKQARDKLKKFSQHVKQSFKPTIDQHKVEQIRFRSVNLQSRAMSSQKIKGNQSPKRIGLRYLQYSKLQADHQKLLVSSQKQQETKTQSKKVDYLAQLKQMNKNRTCQSAHNFIQKLDKITTNKQQKSKKLLEFADRLQKKAKQRQQLQKISGQKTSDNLDSLYLEAIHAKLHLLDQI